PTCRSPPGRRARRGLPRRRPRPAPAAALSTEPRRPLRNRPRRTATRMLSSLDSLVSLEKTLSRGETELRAGVDQIGVCLDAGDLRGEGVALGLQQIELRDGPHLVAVVGLLSGVRGRDAARPRRAAAGDGGSDRLPLPVDGVAGGQPDAQLARTGDVGAGVLA